MKRSSVHRTAIAVLLAGVGGTAAIAPVRAQQVAVGPVATPARDVDQLLTRPVTVSLDHVSLTRAVTTIAANAGIKLFYRSDLLDAVATLVSLRATRMPVGEALEKVLAGTQLRVAVQNDVVTIHDVRGVAVAADGFIVGKVTNGKTKQPVASATITVDDGKGVAANTDGSFRLSLPPGEHKLTVRALGFVRQTRVITITEGQTVSADFALELGTSVLNEVIVTGTVTATERKAIPTPITVITAEDIERRNITRVDQLFRGDVPGILARDQGTARYNADLGNLASSDVYVRGSASLDGAANPIKTYVDGIELTDPKYLGTIDPKSIERIEIITGPQAATIYGSGAMGGVMQIFTKRGNGRTRPDVTLNFRYGMLESNFSNGRTPTHNHGISLAGGNGPQFSYAATGSYVYTGQWQPNLYSRIYGTSLAVTHSPGPLTISANASLTSGENGTTGSTFAGLGFQRLVEEGTYYLASVGRFISATNSKSSSQLLGVNADYRTTSWWQHHLNVGKSQDNFTLVPRRPTYASPPESLFIARKSYNNRFTGAYNTTMVVNPVKLLSLTMVLGATGSNGERLDVNGCMPPASSVSASGCPTSSSVPVIRTDRSVGGFGSWRLGIADRLYLTYGLRGERNTSYGKQHKYDWTPTNGIAYTAEVGDLTVKLLGSYGISTRAPTVDYKKVGYSGCGDGVCEPDVFPYQLSAPDLRPERSRGPQGGIELYYGNLFSMTVNHYNQSVTDLIQSVIVDSMYILYKPDPSGSFWYPQRRYENVAKVRQFGWEGTGSLTVGSLIVRGTYSWNDSRVVEINPTAEVIRYQVGQAFTFLPTHTGSLSASYARGPMSLTLTTNYVGSVIGTYSGLVNGMDVYYSRLLMYIDHAETSIYAAPVSWPGAYRSDLGGTYRLTDATTFTVNVNNLGNSYRSDMTKFNPSLGRQTTIGLSWRPFR